MVIADKQLPKPWNDLTEADLQAEAQRLVDDIAHVLEQSLLLRQKEGADLFLEMLSVQGCSTFEIGEEFGVSIAAAFHRQPDCDSGGTETYRAKCLVRKPGR